MQGWALAIEEEREKEQMVRVAKGTRSTCAETKAITKATAHRHGHTDTDTDTYTDTDRQRERETHTNTRTQTHAHKHTQTHTHTHKHTRVLLGRYRIQRGTIGGKS